MFTSASDVDSVRQMKIFVDNKPAFCQHAYLKELTKNKTKSLVITIKYFVKTIEISVVCIY